MAELSLDLLDGSWAPRPDLWREFQENQKRYAPPPSKPARRSLGIEGLRHAGGEESCGTCKEENGGHCLLHGIPAVPELVCAHFDPKAQKVEPAKPAPRQISDVDRALHDFLNHTEPARMPNAFATAMEDWQRATGVTEDKR